VKKIFLTQLVKNIVLAMTKSKKAVSKKKTSTRCPSGTRKDRKTGKCVKSQSRKTGSKKTVSKRSTMKTKKQSKKSTKPSKKKTSRERCPAGSRKDSKTGKCVKTSKNKKQSKGKRTKDKVTRKRVSKTRKDPEELSTLERFKLVMNYFNKRHEPAERYKKFTGKKAIFRKLSPHRKRGDFRKTDGEKNLVWITYMIENGEYGHNVCYSVAFLAYKAQTRELLETKALIWAITECPYDVVAIEVSLDFGPDLLHANMLIVNKAVTPWEIERFEPHGGDVSKLGVIGDFQDNIDTDFERFFQKEFTAIGKRVKYLRPVDTCPHVGPQRSERYQVLDGFCQTWTLVYLDARLNNPDMTNKEILDHFFHMKSDDLYELVQDYVHKVLNTNIPEEFTETVWDRIGVFLEYAKILKEFDPDSVFGKTFSLEFYRVLASAPFDRTTFFVLLLVCFAIKMNLKKHIREPSAKECLQTLFKTIKGKRLRLNTDPKKFLFHWFVTGKLEDLRSDLRTDLKIL
jgi:hypothetical protein